MIRLIIQNGAHAGEQIHFDQKKTGWIMLGRGQESLFRFPESSVSVRHAMIASENGDYFLLDQNSTNGTFLNGERVQTAKLGTGDVIELGHFGPRLQVIIDADSVAERQDSDFETSPQFDDTARARSPQTVQWTIREAAQNIGLYNPQNDSGEVPPPIGSAGLAIFCAAMGTIVLALTFLNFGLTVSIVAGLTAFVPAMFYLGMFLWLDRYDPEPIRTLAFAFGWGAGFAVFVSGFFNVFFHQSFGELLTGVISAPLIEEGSKGAGVLLIALLFKHDFDSVVDGIVYAGVVALGFATMENVDYYGDSLVKNGVEGLFQTFILRGIFSPFSHVLFTCMTGIGCGIARETYHPVLKISAPLVGYLAAMFLHALWNGLASSSDAFLLGYLMLEVPLFICFVSVIFFLVRREGRILKQTLAGEIERGLITADHVAIAISVFRRSLWVMSAIGNKRLFNARRRYLRAVAKLGLCHWHNKRAVDARGDTDSFSLIPKLQAEIFRLKTQID